MEAAVILVPILTFMVLKMVLEHRTRARAENLRLLEEALRNPALDRATIEALTHQLTGRRPQRSPGAGPLQTVVLSIGWVALFVGIGLLVISGLYHEPGFAIAGIITAISGFGLVTWPFALRELEARRQAP
jgi:predicted permease